MNEEQHTPKPGAWERLDSGTKEAALEALAQWLEIASTLGRDGTVSYEHVSDALHYLKRA
jgi:hypothetical protein